MAGWLAGWQAKRGESSRIGAGGWFEWATVSEFELEPRECSSGFSNLLACILPLLEVKSSGESLAATSFTFTSTQSSKSASALTSLVLPTSPHSSSPSSSPFLSFSLPFYYYYYIKSSQFSIIYHRKLQSTSISSNLVGTNSRASQSETESETWTESSAASSSIRDCTLAKLRPPWQAPKFEELELRTLPPTPGWLVTMSNQKEYPFSFALVELAVICYIWGL